MSLIDRPPQHFSLFTPLTRLPQLQNAALSIFASSVAGSFGYVAQQFGDIAFHHPQDPHALAGMLLAGACFAVSMAAMAIAGSSFLKLINLA